MSLTGTGPRILAAALIAVVLFVLAFFVGRGSSSEAALPTTKAQSAADVTTLKHAPLRAIGAVPALPRPPAKPKKRKTPKKRPGTTVTPPPPPPPPVVNPPPPPPPPPPPSGVCTREFC